MQNHVARNWSYPLLLTNKGGEADTEGNKDKDAEDNIY
jgi:hypothetical protein